MYVFSLSRNFLTNIISNIISVTILHRLKWYHLHKSVLNLKSFSTFSTYIFFQYSSSLAYSLIRQMDILYQPNQMLLIYCRGLKGMNQLLDSCILNQLFLSKLGFAPGDMSICYPMKTEKSNSSNSWREIASQ